MNREIKFRAWNIATKTMIDLKKITPLALNMDTDGLFIPFSDGLILMQFTSLKDKNGKEIYEGDIVEFRPHRTGEIKWQPQGACFYISYNVGTKGFYCDINSLAMYGDDKQIILTDVEVIGNIFENPELLQTNKDKEDARQ